MDPVLRISEQFLDDLVDEWHERPTFYPHVTLKQFLMDRAVLSEEEVSHWLRHGGDILVENTLIRRIKQWGR